MPLSGPGKLSCAAGTRAPLQLLGQPGERCELCYVGWVLFAAQHGFWHVSHSCCHLLSIWPQVLPLNTDVGVLSSHFRVTTQYPRFTLQDQTHNFGLDHNSLLFSMLFSLPRPWSHSFPSATNLKTALIFLTSSPGLRFLQYLTAILILESRLALVTVVWDVPCLCVSLVAADAEHPKLP